MHQPNDAVEMKETESEDEKEPITEFEDVAKKGKKRKKKKKGLGLNVVNLDSFAETVPEDELAGTSFDFFNKC